MFQNAQSFNQDVDSWTPILVKKFENMFNGASRFDGKIFASTGAATAMTSMFQDASSFTGKNAENMVTNLVEDMQSMFKSATVFNAAILTSDTTKWDVAAVTTFANMFNGASSFNQNIANWVMTAMATPAGLGAMFSGASNFQQNLCLWNAVITAANVGNAAVTGMFSSPKCPNPNGLFEETVVNPTLATVCCTCAAINTDDATLYPACVP